MSETSIFTKLIGTIAAENGWLSFSQLEEVLEEQQKSKKTIGQILLKKKILSKEQLDLILELQNEVNIRKDDYLFGHLVVKNKFATTNEISVALEKQKNEKFRRSIGEILVTDKQITQQQCNALLKAQSRIIKNSSKDITIRKKIFCPKCKQQYTIPDPDRYRKVKCKKCNYLFEAGIKELQIITSDSPVSQNDKTFDIDESKSLQNFLAQNQISPMADLNEHAAENLKEGNARYVVGKEIARGGMGAILSTKDTNLRRYIVTKVLIKRTSRIATLRFIEEAQITGQLEHPNIPPVYDLGLNKNNQLYFTMKHIKGETLESIIRKLKADDPETKKNYDYSSLINIFIKVANALSYAHSKRVIHRDIKPENIMIGAYGEVLLMDWGLAKIIGTKEEFEELDEQEEISTVRSQDESSNTIEGTTAGTPTFMSPEQASGFMDELDTKSDIYSLGATFYNTLSLSRPIGGGTLQNVLIKVAKGNYEPLPDNIPEELKAITYKAMKFHKEDRYQTVEDFERDLKQYLLGYSVSAKHDTVWDLIKKFYKRNKLVSIISTAGSAFILISSTFFAVQLNKQYTDALLAKNAALTNLEKFEKEQSKRNQDNKNAAPTYYSKAKDEVAKGDLTVAFQFASTASEYDPNNLEYLYLKSLIALHIKKIPLAKEGFIKCNESKAFQEKSKKYLQLISEYKSKVNNKDFTDNLLIVDKAAGEYQIGVHLEGDLINKINMWTKDLVDTYQGRNFSLELDNDNLIHLNLYPKSADYDLSEFEKYPIQSINLFYSQTTHLNFIKKMPLKKLRINMCYNLKDVSAIANKPLTELHINSTMIKNIDYIRTLKLESLKLVGPTISSIDILKDMPLKELSLQKVPFETLDGIENLPLVRCELKAMIIADLRPLAKSKLLEEVDFTYTYFSIPEQLKLLKVKKLDLSHLKVDLNHLNENTIEVLILQRSRVENFESLTNFKKLKHLTFSPSKVTKDWKDTLRKLDGQLESIGISERQNQRTTNIKDFFQLVDSTQD